MFRKLSNFVVENASIYKKVIVVPNTVKVEIEDNRVLIIGNLGKLTHKLHKFINVQLNDLEYLSICAKYNSVYIKSLVGTTCSLINGMITGVTLGFVKKLQLVGIGYRASIEKNSNILHLIVGFSHPVYYKLPRGIEAQCFSQTEIVLTGIDKQLIGQSAADLRAIRPPEPFKGKGIRYVDEILRNKETKKR